MTQKNDDIYLELIQKQRKECKDSKKLNLSELKRISKNLDTSIFSEDSCSIWTGYITNNTSDVKPSYINFYFRNKKIALHRLLYENYIDNLDKNQYLKYNCKNKGICCNVNHIEVVNSNKNEKINKVNPKEDKEEDNEKEDKNTNLIVNFD
tara:strand:+ start:15285 stop:15737 length:453 start_codon:yes stop_codon:yes gene_type:complete